MQFIKKLKLNGFKSFGDKTELVFKDGVAGIVGPNGCGKSNIVDAFKWVFGEKRVKSLRGENIEDLIFAGNEERKPAGMAEVEVIIDNANSLLPLDYSEISVTRRVFKSGETEYLINKKRVRLKDIHELFANTGVGKGTYSFMEQGKIDMILSTKPEDRRIIFEEAAGISGYKAKLKDTLKTLENTENNLEQVNLLIKEITKERDTLKGQAEKARIYKEKSKRVKELEIQVYLNKYLRLNEKLQAINEKIEKINKKLSDSKLEYEEINNKLEEINKEVIKHNDEKHKSEQEKISLEHQIQSNEEKIDIFNRQVISNEEEIKRLEERKSEIIEKIKRLEDDLKKQEDLYKKNKEKFSEIEDKIVQINKLIDGTNNKININYERINESRNKIKENQDKLVLLKEDLRKYTDEFVKEIDKKKQELEGTDSDEINVKKSAVDIIIKIEENLNNIESNIKENNYESIKAIIIKVKDFINELKDIINKIVIHKDEFRDLIFDENGVYAKKESVDKSINELSDEIFKLQNHISELDAENQKLRKEEKDLERKRQEYYDDRSKLRHFITVNENSIKNLTREIERYKNEIKHMDDTVKNLKEKRNNIKKEIERLEKSNKVFSERLKKVEFSINKFLDEMTKHNQNIKNIREKSKKLLNEIEKYREDYNLKNEDRIKIETGIEDIKNFLYEEYNVKLDDVIKDFNENIDIKKINRELEKLKKEIRDLGAINSLAESLYEDVDKRYKLYLEQKEDLLKAKADLMRIIEDTNKETEKMFMDTFHQINKNYHHIFRKLFGGGSASISLTDPDNVLESGIEINVKPVGKKVAKIDLLSGGERTLCAIGLMFSIFLVKPSPFCVLDEIDAPLDEENNRKFLTLMREFSSKTQFIIVSHNRMTISSCDYLYGITMEEKGISKVVSLDLKKEKIDDYIK